MCIRFLSLKGFVVFITVIDGQSISIKLTKVSSLRCMTNSNSVFTVCGLCPCGSRMIYGWFKCCSFAG